MKNSSNENGFVTCPNCHGEPMIWKCSCCDKELRNPVNKGLTVCPVCFYPLVHSYCQCCKGTGKVSWVDCIFYKKGDFQFNHWVLPSSPSSWKFEDE